MEHVHEEVVRPAPVQPVVDRVRAWIGWFGLSRLVVSAVSVVIVCLGAFWLVRSPVPPAEAVLPRVADAEPPISTLPLPARAPDSTQGAGHVESEATPDEVVVHVAGAVRVPGVYELPAGARVDAAVQAAGGAAGGADLDALNLAAVLADGARIYVPVVGEAVEGRLVSVDPGGSAITSPLAPGPIDVNRASADELDSLPGVGPATAAAIVAERERNGPFLGVDDLERVPGIGPAKLAGLRDLVAS